MALETRVIMTSVLTNLRTSKSIEEALIKIEAMCEDDWIRAAKEASEKLTKKESKG